MKNTESKCQRCYWEGRCVDQDDLEDCEYFDPINEDEADEMASDEYLQIADESQEAYLDMIEEQQS